MKSLRHLSAVSWLLALAGMALIPPLALGQTEESAPKSIHPPCPTISVSCPNDYKDGELLTFVATVGGGYPTSLLTYNWTASTGTIVQGQGTTTIKLKLEGWSTPTATLKVGGLHPSCYTTASCSLSIHKPRPPITMFDSYGILPLRKERLRLEKFATALSKQPGAQGYVFFYGARRGFAGDAKARGERAKDYLVNVLDIASGRIVTVDGGFREQLTVDLWLVPTGETPPMAKPTVDPNEVKLIKRPAKKTAKHPKDH